MSIRAYRRLRSWRRALIVVAAVEMLNLWGWLIYSRPRPTPEPTPTHLVYPVHFGLEPAPRGDDEPPLEETETRRETWPHPRAPIEWTRHRSVTGTREAITLHPKGSPECELCREAK